MLIMATILELSEQGYILDIISVQYPSVPAQTAVYST